MVMVIGLIINHLEYTGNRDWYDHATTEIILFKPVNEVLSEILFKM